MGSPPPQPTVHLHGTIPVGEHHGAFLKTDLDEAKPDVDGRL